MLTTSTAPHMPAPLPWGKSGHRLFVRLAATGEDIQASQRLRYEVFSREMGSQFKNSHQSLDQDHYDDYCHHLQVLDRATGSVVGTTRLLTVSNAVKCGGFYSEHEFELDGLFPLPGRVLEIGRTCIHPDYRRGSTISLLWAGLAQFITLHHIDYLIGCASIPLGDGYYQVYAALNYLRQDHPAPAHLAVKPVLPLPHDKEVPADRSSLPPLIKAYLRLGASICSEPCLDLEFNTADLFIFLDIKHLNPRYQRHFIDRDFEAEICAHSVD